MFNKLNFMQLYDFTVQRLRNSFSTPIFCKKKSESCENQLDAVKIA